MSITITLNGDESILNAEIFPPIDLHNDQYELGLVDFHSYNSIPNIDETNNKFYYGTDKSITIDTGSYELEDIQEYLRLKLGDPRAMKHSNNEFSEGKTENKSKQIFINITANPNTLKSEIICSENIDFSKENCIGALLGFNKEILQPNILHESNLPVNIIKVNCIRIQCNLTSGAYLNNDLVHTIHEFFPSVPPGYKIIEIPKQIIYLPIIVRKIDNISLKIVDEVGRLINFRKENISCRLHIRKV